LRVVSLTKLVEEKYVPSIVNTHYSSYIKKIFTSFSNSTNAHAMVQLNKKTCLPPFLPTSVVAPIILNSVGKRTPFEMQLRREKGLCYLCDDKFNFNHKCHNK